MEHFYNDHPKMGDDFFTYPKLYSRMVKEFNSGSKFVEVGCWMGKSASYMAVEIANSGKKIDFFCVDRYDDQDKDEYLIDPDVCKYYPQLPSPKFITLKNENKTVYGGCTQTPGFTMDLVHDIFVNNMKPVEQYYKLLRMSSVDASNVFEDNSLDFVFIDAKHDYDSIKEDIHCWFPKVKKNGIISGHDHLNGFAGVDKAVREFFSEVEADEECWIHRKIN